MPRTRAQRRHALATALDGDSVSYILSFLPKLGVVPGRLYTLSGSGTQHTCGGLSLKAILAPRRRRLIKCPGDIPRLENAVAAAREGDVVLLTESVELQAPIVAPPFHVTIAAVSRRRFGRYRSDNVPPGQHYSHGQLERARWSVDLRQRPEYFGEAADQFGGWLPEPGQELFVYRPPPSD